MGGTTLESRKQERAAAYDALSPDIKQAVDQGVLKAGMSQDAVYLAWGPASRVSHGGSSAGDTLTWVYEGMYLRYVETVLVGGNSIRDNAIPTSYVRAQVLFVNGVVCAWQKYPKP